MKDIVIQFDGALFPAAITELFQHSFVPAHLIMQQSTISVVNDAEGFSSISRDSAVFFAGCTAACRVSVNHVLAAAKVLAAPLATSFYPVAFRAVGELQGSIEDLAIQTYFAPSDTAVCPLAAKRFLQSSGESTVKEPYMNVLNFWQNSKSSAMDGHSRSTSVRHFS